MSGMELKPCPFCGGDAQLFGQIPAYCGAKVACSECEAESPSFRVLDDCSAAEISAITAWNTRTPDPAAIRADALREAAALMNVGGRFTIKDRVEAILALIGTALSPTAVDNSPAPVAGGKGEK